MGAFYRQLRPVATAMELLLTAGLRGPTGVRRGDPQWPHAPRSGMPDIHGPAALRRALPTGFRRDTVAAVPGPAA